MSITIADLTFSYPQDVNHSILEIPQWSVSSGEQVFLHGPSGAGKSTLLNLIGGLLIAQRGELTVLGERVDEMSARQRDQFRANHIGYVFQQFNLIPHLDVIDNIRLARYLSKEKGGSSAERADIEDLLSSLNIDQRQWRKPTRTLSIGQQQRVAIARAFINQPELLIVDEPTSSLDAKNRDDFISVLLDRVAGSGATLIFVSHDMNLSSHFARVDEISDINKARLAS